MESSGIYTNPNRFAKKRSINKDQITVKDLSAGELAKIKAISANMLEDVMYLTKSQAWLFSHDTVLSERFYLQVLFKIKGFIHPQQFTEHVEELIKENKNLRTLFVRSDDDQPLQVVLKQREAELRFHDLRVKSKDEINYALEKIMASDRRRGFDLAKDRLLRIGIFRTGVKEYAVLVAQPQIVADGWDMGQLFQDLFPEVENLSGEISRLPKKRFSFEQYLQKRSEQDKAPAVKYWEKLLTNLRGVSELPGKRTAQAPYHQSVCTLQLDTALMQELMKIAKNEIGLIALFQTVWGIMLQQYNRSNDAVFGVILSNRSATLQNIEESASIINVIPTRVTCAIDIAFAELVHKQQLQLMLSRPYSYCDPDELQKISGLTMPLFNHFLNFHSFRAGNSFADLVVQEGVAPVCANSFHCCNTDMEIYFRLDAGDSQMETTYNDTVFTKAQIELLQQGFFAILRQVAQKPLIQVCEIKMPSIEEIQVAAINVADQQAAIANLLKTVPLFANLPEAVIQELVQIAKFEYFVEDDMIYSEGMAQEKLYVVYSGNVEISRNAANGWLRTLKILKRGSVLGYEGILDQRPSSVRAEALSSDVRILSFANKDIRVILHKNFELVINLVNELNDQVNKLQKLWISAE